MEKDILAHRKALTTQASDTDPVTAAPPVRTPLGDASTAASRGVNVGQKSVGQKENDEMGKMSVLGLCPSAEAGSPFPEVALAHVVSEGASSAANSGGSIGKKNRRKRRNRKESKGLCLPWPLTLHTSASSASPVLDQTSATGALPVADNVRQESREPRRTGKKGNSSVLSKSRKATAGTLRPAASPVQPPHEGASLAANGEIKRGQKNSHRRRTKKSRKAVASPWPLTIQAWASFKASTPVQTVFAGPDSNNGVNAGHQSRGQSGDADKMSLFTLGQSAKAGAPCSAEAPEEASLDGTPPATNSGEKVGKKKRRRRRNRKDKNALARPWPMTVQAWVSFTAADSVQTVFQEEPLAASTGVNVGQKSWSQLADSEEETKSVLPWSVWEEADAPFSAAASLQTSLEEAPFLDDIYINLNKPIGRPVRVDEEQQLQESAEQDLEYFQSWRNAERYQEDQDFWECTVMNLARQVDCHYCGELCSQERMEALTLTKACAHISTSVMGMQGTEKERVESQTLWMEKWGGF
nr:uncharacterized protein LOC105863842 [Microcebus murinus]